MGDREEEQSFTIHGSVFRDKPGSVKTTRLLHRVLPISAQRSFRDGAFRAVSDYGVAVGAGFSAVLRPRLAARFLGVGRQREDYRYGPHPRQVIEVVQPTREGIESRERGEKPKLIVFVHGGAWGSGCTWMYRLVVDRLTRSNHPHLGSYTVASVGYRVYPDADTTGQVNDLAEAMRWISGNLGTIDFDTVPDVYLMGHSSGAHISLLYLIRQAEQQEAAAAAAAAAVAHNHHTLPSGRSKTGSPGGDNNSGGGDVSDGDGGDVDVDGDGSGGGGGVGGRQVEVEGFIGLAGVYDVHRHYLYESWRGVHEISPMKASNGGMLHTLFDYSHPHLLGGKPNRPSNSWSRTPLAPARSPQHPRPQPQPGGEDAPRSPSPSDTSSTQGTGPSVDGGGGDAAAAAVSGSSMGGQRGQGGQGAGRPFERVRALGRRLPRTLVVHGTADATVPFSQTAAVGAALKTLGVPTVVRYDQGGDHFGMVGQLMFSKESLVETAISQFTSQQAKDDARQERAKDDMGDIGATHVPPLPQHPQPRSRL